MQLIDKTVRGLLLVTIAAVMTACSGHDDDGPRSTAADFEMLMILGIGDVADSSPVASRAPSLPEGGYDYGSGYENHIDVAGEDFRFWFVDSDNRFVGQLSVSGIVALESASSSKYYHVLGKVDRDAGFDPSAAAFKVMVLANWGDYPEPAVGMTVDEIVTATSARYEYEAGADFPTADNLIPLYGIQEYDALKFNENNFASLGLIHLLRSYAKVEVINSDDSALPIESVILTRYNTAGMKAPFGVYRRADYVKNDWASDYTALPTLPAQVSQQLTLPLKVVEEGKHYIVYIPEFRNIGSDVERAAELEVRFVGYPYLSTLEFKDYSIPENATQKYYNVMRNWWYRFTVTKIKGWGDLEVEVDVQPYGSVELKPDFGLDRDEDGNLIIP